MLVQAEKTIKEKITTIKIANLFICRVILALNHTVVNVGIRDEPLSVRNVVTTLERRVVLVKNSELEFS